VGDDAWVDLAVYVVAATGGEGLDVVMAGLDSIALTETLYLVRTDLTQSGLYHHLKRETGPTTPFVGRLDGSPKCKGVAAGRWRRCAIGPRLESVPGIEASVPRPRLAESFDHGRRRCRRPGKARLGHGETVPRVRRAQERPIEEKAAPARAALHHGVHGRSSPETYA
jgi:hypothetical protein